MCLLVVFLLPTLCVVDGIQWVRTVEEDLVKCEGEEVTFPWSFELSEGKKQFDILWSRRQDGATKESRVAADYEGQFKLFGGRDVTQVKEGDAAIKLSNLTTADSGRYTVAVRPTGGTQEVSQQTANLTVAEIPETDSGALTLLTSNQSESDTSASATSGHQQLLCGRFTNLGSPPISVIWEDPDGWYRESSSFDTSTGYFVLDLPKQYKGGSYKCMLNRLSIAYSCLPSDSPLRELASLNVVPPALPDRAAGMDSGTVALIVTGIVVCVAIACFTAFKLCQQKEPASSDEETALPVRKQNGNVIHQDNSANSTMPHYCPERTNSKPELAEELRSLTTPEEPASSDEETALPVRKQNGNVIHQDNSANSTMPHYCPERTNSKPELAEELRSLTTPEEPASSDEETALPVRKQNGNVIHQDNSANSTMPHYCPERTNLKPELAEELRSLTTPEEPASSDEETALPVRKQNGNVIHQDNSANSTMPHYCPERTNSKPELAEELRSLTTPEGKKYSPKGKEPDSPDEEIKELFQKQDDSVTRPDILYIMPCTGKKKCALVSKA